MIGDGFKHLDPTATQVYRSHTVWYGFTTNRYCFKCRVKNGYLTGKRDQLPPGWAWAIGQHIDTMAGFVHTLMPLQLCQSGRKR